MTLNGIIALILRYFTEFDSFAERVREMVEHRPIISAEYRLRLLAKTDPPCSAVSAIAELLVQSLRIFIGRPFKDVVICSRFLDFVNTRDVESAL